LPSLAPDLQLPIFSSFDIGLEANYPFRGVPDDVMQKIVRRRLLTAAFRYRIPDFVRRDTIHEVAVTAVLADGTERERYSERPSILLPA